MIIDFGESIVTDKPDKQLVNYDWLKLNVKGTLKYIDPLLRNFVQNNWQYNPPKNKKPEYFSYNKGDVYSLGIMFLEMMDNEWKYR
jgi:serine/threonine protein kinase